MVHRKDVVPRSLRGFGDAAAVIVVVPWLATDHGAVRSLIRVRPETAIHHLAWQWVTAMHAGASVPHGANLLPMPPIKLLNHVINNAPLMSTEKSCFGIPDPKTGLILDVFIQV